MNQLCLVTTCHKHEIDNEQVFEVRGRATVRGPTHKNHCGKRLHGHTGRCLKSPKRSGRPTSEERRLAWRGGKKTEDISFEKGGKQGKSWNANQLQENTSVCMNNLRRGEMEFET